MSMLRSSAASNEEKVYMVATSKVDYLLRIALKMVSSKSKRNASPLLQQYSSVPVSVKEQHKVVGHYNDLLAMQPQGNQALDGTADPRDGQMPGEGSSTNISDLPHDMLHAIMSSLPAVDLVLTGTLSSRWRNLWTSSACLDIDVNQFGRQRGQQFSRFVSWLLERRGSRALDAFRLHTAETAGASSWIAYGLRNDSRVVEFSEDLRCEPVKLEHGVVDFTSRHLKILLLSNVCLDASVFHPINSACPSLESLELRDSSLEIMEISSRSLLHLVMDNCCLFENLVISTPSLLSLCVKTPQHRAPMLKRFPCIQAAEILLDECFHSSDEGMDDDDDDDEQDEKDVNHRMLGSLREARSIELIVPLREGIFDREIRLFPMFNNLTSLTLGEWCMSDNFSPLLRFLWHSPVLQDLTLKLDMEVCQYCMQDEPTAFAPVKPFTIDHLKKLTIYSWAGDDRVGKLLKALDPICKSLPDVKLVPLTTPELDYLVSKLHEFTGGGDDDAAAAASALAVSWT
ncbi:hypothetical protein GUJ93_ZPchr0008g12744 [Zizania palustris]|uniref:F-box domain-containing protein n=1 Tax=Zizania palustris TaxID=103762 RepID=A0A8J5RJG3_ZIZPA|nr:hypothetical protein GUJ93_ZPchr0008g12744 [Zizania palustris]